MKVLSGCFGALLTSCQLWSAELPDPECRSLEIRADTELVVTAREVRRGAAAVNGAVGELSFAARIAALSPEALWALVGTDGSELTPDAYPFRLLAVVNRTDLAEQLAPESPAGEARLVYTMTNGPGDDPTSQAVPLTVIFEYSLGREETAASWAARFHGAELSALVRDFTTATTPDAPHLAQVRINDARRGVAVLTELGVEGTTLVLRGLRNTPRRELAGEPALVDFVRDQATAIRAGLHRTPDEWLATSAVVEPVDWHTGADAELARAFEQATCAGCHSELGPSHNGFHLSEDARGEVALSPFLEHEELPRREATMRARLCSHSTQGSEK
jgi:hypothetical protein